MNACSLVTPTVSEMERKNNPTSAAALVTGGAKGIGRALALALAERLPGLGAEAERRALESLFIDEGFSYLDSDTLDIVASALEVLGGSRDRLVGVVTHLPALAERMPARITVAKSPAGSTLSVE